MLLIFHNMASGQVDRLLLLKYNLYNDGLEICFEQKYTLDNNHPTTTFKDVKFNHNTKYIFITLLNDETLPNSLNLTLLENQSSLFYYLSEENNFIVFPLRTKFDRLIDVIIDSDFGVEKQSKSGTFIIACKKEE